MLWQWSHSKILKHFSYSIGKVIKINSIYMICSFYKQKHEQWIMNEQIVAWMPKFLKKFRMSLTFPFEPFISLAGWSRRKLTPLSLCSYNFRKIKKSNKLLMIVCSLRLNIVIVVLNFAQKRDKGILVSRRRICRWFKTFLHGI